MLFALTAGISRNLSHEGLGRAGNARPRTEVSQRGQETTPSERLALSSQAGGAGGCRRAGCGGCSAFDGLGYAGAVGAQLLSPGRLKGTSGPLTPSSKVGKYSCV